MPANRFGIDYGEILHTKNALMAQQQQQQMNAFAMKRAGREEGAANAFAQHGGDLLSGDPMKSKAALGEIAKFDPGKALEIASRMTAEQRTATLEKSEYTGRALLGLKGVPMAQRVQAWSAMAAQLKARGIEAPPQIDTSDQGLDLAISNSLSLKDAMAQANADRTFAAGRGDREVAQRNVEATRADTAAYRGATLAQGDARNAIAAQRAGNGLRITQTPEGGFEVVQGSGAGGSNINLRQEELKGAQLYARAVQQLPIALENFEALASIGNQVGGAIERATGNSFLTAPEYQRARNAVQDIVQNYIYAVSGAQAPEPEVKRNVDLLMPKPGESAESISDKKARMSQMVDSIRLRAGRGASLAPSGADAPAGKGGAPQPGVVEDGYRFKGGDPADPKRWEPVS